jgi:hypothetical protein
MQEVAGSSPAGSIRKNAAAEEAGAKIAFMRGWGVLFGGALTAIVLAVASAHATSRAPARCGKLLPPSSGAYFGMMYPSEAAPDTGRISALAQETKTSPRFITYTVPWGARLTFPNEGIQRLWRAGYVPMVRLWTFPTLDYAPDALPQSSWPGPVPMSAIAAGKFDDQIRAFADAARASEIPLLLDIDNEMNNAHPWGGRYDGGGMATGYGDPSWPDGPEHYRDGYRRIVTIFREEGATNVTFFFQPDSVYGYGTGQYWEPFEQYKWYYPGDDYVDWMGFSLYSSPRWDTGANATFEEKLQTWHDPASPGPYVELTALGSRPIALNELGFNSMPSEDAKAQWVTDASAVIESGRYPRIAAVSWYGDATYVDSPWNADPLSSPTFEHAYSAAFSQPYYASPLQFSGDCLPAAPSHVVARRVGRTERITWSPSPNATAYEVRRDGKTIAKVAGAAFADRHASAGRRHAFTVRAANPLGAGPWSAAASTKP